jgi:hypothetical protein
MVKWIVLAVVLLLGFCVLSGGEPSGTAHRGSGPPAGTASNAGSERPRANTGLQGRWWLVVRTDDGRLPEAGPFPSLGVCETAQDRVVADIRAQSGSDMANRARTQSYCAER